MKACVFNIQRHSIHDGPGIRTTVFLKGCPLHCPWCCNPESQSPSPFLYREKHKCLQCYQCMKVCKEHAIHMDEKGGQWIQHESCLKCRENRCINICPSGALSWMGEEKSVEEIEQEVKRDGAFYKEGKGGITVSGGEPLLQAEYVRALFQKCHQDGFTTAIETCLYVKEEQLDKVLPVTDYFFCDYKHFDKDVFRSWTGGSLEVIEKNLKKILNKKREVTVRIPLIPGFNAQTAILEKMCEKLEAMGARQVELLPYHRLGKVKYENMNLSYPMGDRELLSHQQIEELKAIPEKYHLEQPSS